MKVLVIDIDKCNGCYNCQVACKDEHVGNDWTPIAKPQPDTGQFWMKVTDIVQGTVPKVRVRYMHDTCQQCDEAPCIAGCKSHAIYKREDGIVIIDPETCTGNRNCLDACPTGALKFGEEEELKDLIAKAETLKPESGAKPRVYYLNLPNKFFIAGAVYDPEADECLEGATVTLTNLASNAAETLATDYFGDFWFEKQEPGRYSLRIEKAGYNPVTLDAVEASKDLNVGDIELRVAAT